MRRLHEGTFSEGLSTKVLPQAMATGNIHSGTIAGKLNGVMPAHTPTGCSSEWQSTPRPTSSACSPFSRCGTPLANSITSMPRCTEPAASASVLPCSSEASFESSSRCCSISSRKRVRMRARRSGVVSRQAGKAALAAATAASISSLPASGTWRITSPLAGLNTSPMRPPGGWTR